MARLDGSKDSYPRKRRKMTPEEHERRRQKKELEQAQQSPQQPKRIGRPPKRKENDVDLTTILGQEDPNEAEHFQAAMKATNEADPYGKNNTPTIQRQNSLQSTPSPVKTSPISTRSESSKNPNRPQVMNSNVRGHGGKQIHLMKQNAVEKGRVTAPVTTANISGSQGRGLASSDGRSTNNNDNNKATGVNGTEKKRHTPQGGDKHSGGEKQRKTFEDKAKESGSTSSQAPLPNTNNNNVQKQQNVQKTAAGGVEDSANTAKDKHSAGDEAMSTEKDAGARTGKNSVDGNTTTPGTTTGKDTNTKPAAGTTTTAAASGATALNKSAKKAGSSKSPSKKTSQPGSSSTMSRHAYTCTNPQTGMIPPIVNTFHTPYGVWTNTITFTPHNVIYPGSFPSSTTNLAPPVTDTTGSAAAFDPYVNMMTSQAPFNPIANMMASQAAANSFYSRAMVQGYYNGANVNGMFGMQQPLPNTTQQPQQQQQPLPTPAPAPPPPPPIPIDPVAEAAKAMADYEYRFRNTFTGGKRGKDMRPRKPRNCTRCKKFEGANASTCVGRVGNLGGVNACEYFNEDGSKRILRCKRCEKYEGDHALECIGRFKSKGGEESCEYFEPHGTEKIPCLRCEKYNGSHAYRCAGRLEGGGNETFCEYFNEDGTTKVHDSGTTVDADADVDIEINDEASSSLCKRCQRYDGPHADECSGGGGNGNDKDGGDETLCEYFNEDGTRRVLRPPIVP